MLMLGFGMRAAAQDNKAAIDQVAALIKNKAPEKEVKAVAKKFKKNAEVLTGIGRVYYELKDTANARDYATQASKLQYGPAFILLGDLAALAEDGGQAASFYDQAIYFDPKNPDGYTRYATVYRKISPSQAIAKIDELGQQRPDIAIDALKGRILYQANEFDEAIKAFAKADRSKMEERDLRSFAMAYYLTGKHQSSLEIAEFALAKSPRDAGFNRLAFFCNTDLHNYDKALEYADRLFNKSDSAKLTYFDYSYYGNALSGAKKHDEAIAAYKQALEQEFDSSDKRAGVMKQLSDAYKGMDDYPNAIKYFEQFIQDVSKASASDYHSLAQLHVQHANTLEGDQKRETFLKADKIYEDMGGKYADIDDFLAFQRARIGMYMDPESKEELAKPHYERLIELINAKGEKDATDTKRLIECYRYLISYYLVVKDDTATAKEWAVKLQEIDPENETAKQVLELK